MNVVRLLRAPFRLLLHLYPRRYRDEFGWEMQSVFEDALADALEVRLSATLVVAWRELCDLPRAAVIAHLQEWRHAMDTRGVFTRPLRWWAMLAALSVFALPVLTASFTMFSRLVEQSLFLGLLAYAVVALVVDTVRSKRIPHWALPYAGLLLVVPVSSLVWRSGPMARLHGQVVRPGDELSRYVWQAVRDGALWLSLVVVLGLITVLCALLPHLRPAWRAIRREWTGLSFVLYGTAVYAYLVDLNEYEHEGPYVVVGMLSLALGAWAYLRGRTARHRIVPLLVGMTLAMWTLALGKWVIVPRQEWPMWFAWHPPERERWFESLSELIAWAWMTVALLAPALLSVLRRSPEGAPSTRLA